MTLPIDNPREPGNIVENALRTLSVDAISTGLARVALFLPDGRHFEAEIRPGLEIEAAQAVLAEWQADNTSEAEVAGGPH